ncbi:MAG TPA: hypothetical protein VFG25_05235 [Nitrosopumilaceae archaeon]|nr:hypothetical protein [Nitrosopumilaceae archaeon]
MTGRLFIGVLVFLIFLSIATSQVSAHSLFNSAEEFLGGYRVQVATLPEFPNVGEKSQILFRVTDGDFNEVDRFTMGVRVFFNDEQIYTFQPKSHEDSHWETDFVFENPGNHIFKVDLYDMPDTKSLLTYTFNMSTQSPFGYVFFISIIIGALTFAVVVGYIYLPRILKSRFKP